MKIQYYLTFLFVLISIIFSPAATNSVFPEKANFLELNSFRKEIPPVEKKKVKRRKKKRKKKRNKNSSTIFETGVFWMAVLTGILLGGIVFYLGSFFLFVPLWFFWAGLMAIVLVNLATIILVLSAFESDSIALSVLIIDLIIGLLFLILGLVFSFSFLWIVGICMLVIFLLIALYVIIKLAGIDY